MVNRVDGSKTGDLSGEVQIIARRVDLASFGIACIQSRFFSGLRPQVGYRQLSAEYVVPLHAHICCSAFRQRRACGRAEEHTSELQSLLRIWYAVVCLKKNKNTSTPRTQPQATEPTHTTHI